MKGSRSSRMYLVSLSGILASLFLASGISAQSLAHESLRWHALEISRTFPRRPRRSRGRRARRSEHLLFWRRRRRRLEDIRRRRNLESDLR